jgi:thiol-disulfide isomerase/thioredoxin
LLVKDVAAEFGGKVRVSIEEYGNSPMADRFGVRRYPVVFVDDVLLARPKDFGFGGPEDVSTGLYVPWREPPNQQRFKDDLRRAVTRRVAGEGITGLDVSEVTTAANPADGPERLPSLPMRTIAGRTLGPADAAGKVTVVEMWATWCPPCRSTLAWLNDFRRSRAADVNVVAVAVDSKAEDVATLMSTLKPSYDVVMATPDILNAFGTVAAVPKLLVFDRTGKLIRVFYGAPPDLHQQIEAVVSAAIK